MPKDSYRVVTLQPLNVTIAMHCGYSFDATKMVKFTRMN